MLAQRIALGHCMHASESLPKKFRELVGRAPLPVRHTVQELQALLPRSIKVIVTGEPLAGVSRTTGALAGGNLSGTAVSLSTSFIHCPGEATVTRVMDDAHTLVPCDGDVFATLQSWYRRGWEGTPEYEVRAPVRLFMHQEENHEEGSSPSDVVQMMLIDGGRQYGTISPFVHAHLVDTTGWCVMVVVLSGKSRTNKHMESYLRELEANLGDRKPLFVVLEPFPDHEWPRLIEWLRRLNFHVHDHDILRVTLQPSRDGMSEEMIPKDLQAFEDQVGDIIDKSIARIMDPLRGIIARVLEMTAERLRVFHLEWELWELFEGVHTMVGVFITYSQVPLPLERVVQRPRGPFANHDDAEAAGVASANQTEDWARTVATKKIKELSQDIMDVLLQLRDQLLTIPKHLPNAPRNPFRPVDELRDFEPQVELSQWYRSSVRAREEEGITMYDTDKAEYRACVQRMHERFTEQGHAYLRDIIEIHCTRWVEDLYRLFGRAGPTREESDQPKGIDLLLASLEILLPSIYQSQPFSEHLRTQRLALESFQLSLNFLLEETDYREVFRAFQSMVQEESIVEGDEQQ